MKANAELYVLFLGLLVGVLIGAAIVWCAMPAPVVKAKPSPDVITVEPDNQVIASPENSI